MERRTQMPRFEQPARLVFDAEDEQTAYAVEDDAVSALNAAGAQLHCRARLHMDPSPPRELPLLPRVGVLVSAEQVIAAAADIYDAHDAAPVQLELAGSILSVGQGDWGESYSLDGHPVEYPAVGDGPSRPALVLTAVELKRAAAAAVAQGGERGVLLSQPIDDEQRPPRAAQ